MHCATPGWSTVVGEPERGAGAGERGGEMVNGDEVVRHRDRILGRLGGTLARVTSQGRAELAEKKRPHLVGCCPLSHSVPVGPKPEDKSQYFRYITGGPDDNK